MPELRTALADVTAAAWAGLAVIGFASPGYVVGTFDEHITSASYRAEIRAVYGGMSLAFAGALVWANRDRSRRRLVLKTIGLATAGLGAGRLATAVTDRRLDPWPNGVFLVSEAAMAAVLLTS